MDIILDTLPDFVKSYLKHYKDLVPSHKLLRNIGVYINGLIMEIEKKNIQNINEHRLTENYHNLRNTLSILKYDEDIINNRRIEIFQKLQQTRSRIPGVLIFDDTGNRKSGENTFGSRKQYLGCLGKVETGQVTVTSHYADRSKDYPLHLSLYVPKDWINEHPEIKDANSAKIVFHTKGELALSQLKVIDTENMINYSHIVFDGWYFQNSTFIKEINKDHNYVCQCYRNQVVYKKRIGDIASNEYTLGVVIGDLKDEDFHSVTINTLSGKEKTQYVTEFEIKFKLYGRHKVCVTKSSLSDPISDAKILVTNDLRLNANEMIEVYLLRDRVEKFYQAIKEHLGADEYQVRKALAIKRHWLLVYLAFSMIVFYQLTGGISFWTKKYPKTFGETLKIFRLILFGLTCSYFMKNEERLKAFLLDKLGKDYKLLC